MENETAIKAAKDIASAASGFDIEDTWVYGYGMDNEKGTMRQVLYISDE